ncbi:unnamed protein product [Brassica rapa subsp. narinosa]
MAKQNATSGTLASREFYKESSQPSNALKKTTVALEQSLRDTNGGRDLNEIISEVDGEKFGKAFSFQLKLGDFNFTFQLKLGEDDHGPDDNGDVAELAKDVAPSNGESVKKKARQE